MISIAQIKKSCQQLFKIIFKYYFFRGFTSEKRARAGPGRAVILRQARGALLFSAPLSGFLRAPQGARGPRRIMASPDVKRPKASLPRPGAPRGCGRSARFFTLPGALTCQAPGAFSAIPPLPRGPVYKAILN
jgi:hypothetical protein